VYNVTRTGPNGDTQPFCSQLRNAPRADTLLIQKLSIEATGGKGLPVTWDGHDRQGRAPLPAASQGFVTDRRGRPSGRGFFSGRTYAGSAGRGTTPAKPTDAPRSP
jgi:hypothetical protein